MAQTLLAFHCTPPTRRSVSTSAGTMPAKAAAAGRAVAGRQSAAPGLARGAACFGTRTLGASRRVRLWLSLRVHAWLRGRVFELAQVTPHYLGQLEVPDCPVTRQPLGQAEASVDRVCDRAGYAAGNLAMMSAAANRAKASLGWDEAQQNVRRAETAAGGCVAGLTPTPGRAWRC